MSPVTTLDPSTATSPRIATIVSTVAPVRSALPSMTTTVFAVPATWAVPLVTKTRSACSPAGRVTSPCVEIRTRPVWAMSSAADASGAITNRPMTRPSKMASGRWMVVRRRGSHGNPPVSGRASPAAPVSTELSIPHAVRKPVPVDPTPVAKGPEGSAPGHVKALACPSVSSRHEHGPEREKVDRDPDSQPRMEEEDQHRQRCRRADDRRPGPYPGRQEADGGDGRKAE